MGALAYLCDDTRGDWGAASGGVVNVVPVSDKDQFLSHWDGGSALGLAAKSHAQCLARVKAVQTFHMGSSRGWADIGYNTLVCPHGRLIEGRGVLTVGAQCPGYNRSGIGSQFMIGGSDGLPAVMLNRQRKFYDDLYQIRKEVQRKMGHRDGTSTSCPGDPVYGWVVKGMPIIGATPTPTPTPPPAPVVVNPPGPRHPFPLPSSAYYFGRNDGRKYSVSGYYGRTFNGRLDRSWIQEFASQLSRRGWDIGKGRKYLTTDGNNGYFGPEYERLTKAFQSSRTALKGDVDGHVGPNTWKEAFFAKVT